MESVKYKICYWYHEYQDMAASVPTCDYYRQYGECPCEPECKHFITKKEIDNIVRKEEEWIQAVAEVLLKVPPTESDNRHYIKIYADDEPAVKAEKLYQICGEIQNREVAEWLKEYFPLSYDNWIPVSEKLPDEDDYNEYLVIDDRGYMAVGNYRHDAKAWDSGNFGWLEIRDKTDEFPWGIGKVIAWYKPKPYKESEVEE